jgi:hypothetical protein
LLLVDPIPEKRTEKPGAGPAARQGKAIVHNAPMAFTLTGPIFSMSRSRDLVVGKQTIQWFPWVGTRALLTLSLLTKAAKLATKPTTSPSPADGHRWKSSTSIYATLPHRHQMRYPGTNEAADVISVLIR